jgi:hypothetical protein
VQQLTKDDVSQNKCFVYISKVPKDSLVYETKNTFEYGWAADNARLVIETKEYDPIKEKQAKEKGYSLVWRETAQYINGSFKIQKGILIFTPDKLENYNIRKFQLINKSKTQKLDYLKDENNNRYVSGDCAKTLVSVGM